MTEQEIESTMAVVYQMRLSDLTDMEIESIMAVVYQMRLSDLTDMEIAIANNGINGFGYIGQGSRMYAEFLEMGLIKDSGYPHHGGLSIALTAEVSRRIDAGTWGKESVQ